MANGVGAANTIKVAILGGGMASMATAFELTRPGLNYDVTIYQRGWRLGGKGASGRDAGNSQRIEEHGLHVWFGFYQNAFAVMNDCYTELNRPAAAPLSCIDDAFFAAPKIVLFENKAGKWIPWEFYPPTIPGTKPWEPPVLPDFWHIAEQVTSWFQKWWQTLLSEPPAGADQALNDAVTIARTAIATSSSPSALLPQFRASITRFGELLWTYLTQLMCTPDLLARLRAAVVNVFHDFRTIDDALRLFHSMYNTAAAVMRGIIDDDLFTNGFDSINGEELSAWLTRHGASDESLKAPLVTAWYDMAFAYLDGDINQRNMAAGAAVMCLLRLLFTYRGAFAYKMRAGMGDTIFGPLYEVLKKRGVKFEFFQYVTNLGLSADGKQIDSVTMIPQVKLQDPTKEYFPLVDVKGLPCWPSEPDWNQLEAAAVPHNFEWEVNPLNYPAKTLRRQNHDFDLVVLGISVGALNAICPELSAANPNFKAMLEHSATTMTQSFQLWVNFALGGAVGSQTAEDCTLTGFVEPLDTYADMSHLIAMESWTAPNLPNGIAYFCGVLKDPAAPETQADANNRVKDGAINYLGNNVAEIWPHSATGDGTAMAPFDFQWKFLVDPMDRQGPARFDSQYWLANHQPSERYVLTPAGSVIHRMKAEGSGITNLFLAGDWVKTGLDAGCIECATMAGRQAARAITQKPLYVPGEDDKWLKLRS